ncbi:hypothetical protein LUZ60_002182 [Juncus effusus]|nr:hypothetical protein LUZ60_002182 [Juncus effusus]
MATTTTSAGLVSCYSSAAASHGRRRCRTSGDVGPALFIRLPQRSSYGFFRLHVIDSKELETSSDTEISNEKSESDKLVDGIDFGMLCDEFECISSPSVEATARQLARDILELREGNRALGSFAVSVKYKDPLRTFVGREKYKRALWATTALDNPVASVQEMAMLSTSELRIKWTLKGKPKNPLISTISGDLILQIDSKFVINQISGQVVEHVESWDLSKSSFVAQSYFWVSRRVFSVKESGKDVVDGVKSIMSPFEDKDQDNMEIYRDMSGDPTKFFQRDDGLLQDVYQIVFLLAVIYFIVEFLKATIL